MGCMDIDVDGVDEAPQGFKYMRCRYCDELMVVGERRRKAPSHVLCGVSEAQENMRQIAAKDGPYYDRWLAGQRAYLERLGEGGPPPDGMG
jgi:hypothetical protein